MDGFYKWNSFSTTQERWTGEFDNEGFPIYIKGFYLATLPTNMTVLANSIKSIISECGSAFWAVSGQQNYFPLPFHDSARTIHLIVSTNSELQIFYSNYTSSQVNNINFVITFTKTTDTAGTIPPFSN